jgi:hypothetical protein
MFFIANYTVMEQLNYLFVNIKRLKISNGKSEAVNRKTDNTMEDKHDEAIIKIILDALYIEQHEPH